MAAPMWDPKQVEEFVGDVVRDAGPAAQLYLTPRVRYALIAERAFAICRTQLSGSVTTLAMNELLVLMLQRAAKIEWLTTADRMRGGSL